VLQGQLAIVGQLDLPALVLLALLLLALRVDFLVRWIH
jgi:hypothetical protein